MFALVQLHLVQILVCVEYTSLSQSASEVYAEVLWPCVTSFAVQICIYVFPAS